jgi:hypothetical protein
MAEKQIELFKAAARTLECDPSEARFNAALGKIARAKSVEPTVKKPKAERGKPAK